MIVQPVVEPMDSFTALVVGHELLCQECCRHNLHFAVITGGRLFISTHIPPSQ